VHPTKGLEDSVGSLKTEASQLKVAAEEQAAEQQADYAEQKVISDTLERNMSDFKTTYEHVEKRLSSQVELSARQRSQQSASLQVACITRDRKIVLCYVIVQTDNM